RKITVEFAGEIPDIEQLRNYVGFIDSEDYKKPSPYYIREPEMDGNKLTFHTDIPLIRGEAGWKGNEKARVQQGKSVQAHKNKQLLIDVKPGDLFTIRNRLVMQG